MGSSGSKNLPVTAVFKPTTPADTDSNHTVKESVAVVQQTNQTSSQTKVIPQVIPILQVIK